MEVPESWLGKSIIELDIRKKYGVNIMAIKHNDSINVNVEPDIVLTEDITLLVLGDYKNLKNALRFKIRGHEHEDGINYNNTDSCDIIIYGSRMVCYE